MNKKHIVYITLAAITIGIISFSGLSSQHAAAADTLDCGVLPQSLCDSAKDDGATTLENTGVWQLLRLAVIILTAGAGIAAIGGIVYGAVMYTTAGGNQEQVKKARGIITNVVIGIVAYAAMFMLLEWLLPGGIMGGTTGGGTPPPAPPCVPGGPCAT